MDLQKGLEMTWRWYEMGRDEASAEMNSGRIPENRIPETRFEEEFLECFALISVLPFIELVGRWRRFFWCNRTARGGIGLLEFFVRLQQTTDEPVGQKLHEGGRRRSWLPEAASWGFQVLRETSRGCQQLQAR